MLGRLAAPDLTRLVERHRRAVAAAAATCFAILLCTWAWEREIGALPGERFLIDHVHGRAANSDLVWQASMFFKTMGSALVVVGFVALLFLIVRREAGTAFALVVPAAAAAGLVARGLKAIWDPSPLLLEVEPYVTGGALPSGHAAYATAVFGLVALLAVSRRRVDVALPCLAAIAGMGVAVVGLGEHLPSDVLAGYALGAGWLLVLLLAAARLSAASRRSAA